MRFPPTDERILRYAHGASRWRIQTFGFPVRTGVGFPIDRDGSEIPWEDVLVAHGEGEPFGPGDWKHARRRLARLFEVAVETGKRRAAWQHRRTWEDIARSRRATAYSLLKTFMEPSDPGAHLTIRGML